MIKIGGYRVWKRAIDIVGGTFGLVVTAPISLMAATAICMSMGRPIFFSQRRPGKDGTLFTMYKFRTMKSEAYPGEPSKGRVTRVGRFLRATSIDELPEFVNVIKGEMSLVGPRPLLPKYLTLYSKRQARRHEVRPGLTGLAQVAGRNSLSWEERLELDVEYVESLTFRGDISILLSTVSKVLRREGISAPGHQGMPLFQGNEEGR